MDYDFKQNFFSRALMSGLFAGIIATIVNLAYNYIYRSTTNLNPSEIINVSSLIFITLIILVVSGIAYFVLVNFLKKGRVVYIILFIALTLLSILGAFSFQRSDDPLIASQFRGLFLGVNIIIGASATFLIPYLVDHDKLFN